MVGYASYEILAEIIQHRFRAPKKYLRELFSRLTILLATSLPLVPNMAKLSQATEIKIFDNIHCLGPLGFRESLKQEGVIFIFDSLLMFPLCQG
jgi:hypothetical protein